MSNLSEISDALNLLEESGANRENITVLHCTTNYPAMMSEINLRAMVTIRNEFQCAVGYSDHSLGSEVALGAVALGATIIEKHFTLDKNLPGPDHKASLNPNELKDFVYRIRNLEKAMGNGDKVPTDSELVNMKIARRSIVASAPIAKGEIFSSSNLTSKRPGIGISPMRLPRIIGTFANRSYGIDDLIEEE